MKLKCKSHDSRVMVLDDHQVLHRSKGDECADAVLTIGGQDLPVVAVALIGVGLMERENKRGTDPARELLKEVFGG
jgi:hypothetical protein